MLKQIKISNRKAIDLIFQEMYLANARVNPRKKPQIFYKMNLLLKYQNRELKWF